MSLRKPMDCNMPSSTVHGILQAIILEWGAIPFSKGSSQPRDWTWDFCIAGRFFTSESQTSEPPVSVVQMFSCVWLLVTSWTVACQFMPFTICQSLLRLMPIESVMLSNHLIPCRPLLLPSIFPSIRVFSALRIRSTNYWGFSFIISPSNELSGLISIRIDWLDLLSQSLAKPTIPPQKIWKNKWNWNYVKFYFFSGNEIFFFKINQICYIKQSLCLSFNKKTVCILKDSENLTIWCNPFPSD